MIGAIGPIRLRHAFDPRVHWAVMLEGGDSRGFKCWLVESEPMFFLMDMHILGGEIARALFELIVKAEFI